MRAIGSELIDNFNKIVRWAEIILWTGLEEKLVLVKLCFYESWPTFNAQPLTK